MSKTKFASLTAGLLARKGEAEPSATPFADQLLTRVGGPAVDLRPMIQNTPQRPQPSHFGPPVFGRQLTVVPPSPGFTSVMIGVAGGLTGSRVMFGMRAGVG